MRASVGLLPFRMYWFSICKLMMMGAKSNSNLGLAPVCYRRVQVQVVVCWGLIFGMGLAALSAHRLSINRGGVGTGSEVSPPPRR